MAQEFRKCAQWVVYLRIIWPQLIGPTINWVVPIIHKTTEGVIYAIYEHYSYMQAIQITLLSTSRISCRNSCLYGPIMRFERYAILSLSTHCELNLRLLHTFHLLHDNQSYIAMPQHFLLPDQFTQKSTTFFWNRVASDFHTSTFDPKAADTSTNLTIADLNKNTQNTVPIALPTADISAFHYNLLICSIL